MKTSKKPLHHLTAGIGSFLILLPVSYVWKQQTFKLCVCSASDLGSGTGICTKELIQAPQPCYMCICIVIFTWRTCIWNLNDLYLIFLQDSSGIFKKNYKDNAIVLAFLFFLTKAAVWAIFYHMFFQSFAQNWEHDNLKINFLMIF